MRSIFWAILALYIIPTNTVFSQKTSYTIVKGKVTDAETKEGLAFVSVAAPGFAAGTRTDENGFYLLRTEQKITKIQFNYIGYVMQVLPVKTGEQQTLDVVLTPAATQLEEVTVKAKKYTRKDNPVVELIELVIAHRDQNHIADLATYQDEQYEKIFLGLSNLSEDFKTKRFLRPMRFVLENIDTSKLAGLPVTPIFLQENVMDYYSRSNPRQWKKYIKASKSVRFGEMVDDDGMDKGLQYLYQDVDIYDNYVEMLSDQFMSPIAKNAPLFYRYYAADTIEEAGKKVIRLEFYPKNKLDMLLQGDLYIALDSTYAVTRINFSINPDINLNWVKELVVEQDFHILPSGKWVLATEDYRMHFGLNKRGVGMVAQRLVTHRNPLINPMLPDSVLRGTVSEIVTSPGAAKVVDNEYWETARPAPLNAAEAATYTNLDSLRRTRFYKVVTRIGYVVFGAHLDLGKFQIGPVSTFYSFNEVEGSRLRFGGRTGPKMSKHWRLEAWAGYGFRDLRWKYSLGGVYGLKGTQFNKFPTQLVRINYLHDVLLPLQNFQGSQEASIGNSVVRGSNDKFFYYDRFYAQYEREFQNHFSYMVGGEHRQFRPAGALLFEPAAGGPAVQNPVFASSAFVQLRYAPGETFYQGGSYRSIVDFNYIATLRYSKGIKGIVSGQYDYHELVASLYKYSNTPPIGYDKLYIEAGGVFGKVPFPLLTVHRGNQTYFTQQFSYNLMNFMEFVSDRYATLMVEHYFAGFFLNKIPLIRKLKWREACSLKVLYGQVSAQNRPSENSGLLKFPTFPDGTPITYTLEKEPYIEASVGITNIFKVLRVDLIRRFTYLDHPGATKYGVRFGIWVEF
ncbi:MAG: carboxypeptidase-like regulatory domain-containing protein [Phycisphaerae bacterium]|nr:carboxypeptidase-like regulatory domain-containing protein [Saprospiraceae bacterium]